MLAAGEPPPVAPGDTAALSGNGPVKAMPPVRKLARDLGVDINAVSGSGPNGRIMRPDVERMAASGATAAASTTTQSPARESIPTGGQRIPLRGIRRTIAERMADAHRLVVPVTHVEECDVTELDATRRLANERSPEGVKLTVLPFIVKAVVAGLKDHPILNSSLDEDAQEIVVHDRYDIGVAVDTPSGLVVPVVRDADRKRVSEIAEDIDRLASGARDGSLKPDELRGSTFTVTSPGPFGGLMATPIVFHPQAAILGVHRAGQRAVVRDGQIVARLMMNLLHRQPDRQRTDTILTRGRRLSLAAHRLIEQPDSANVQVLTLANVDLFDRAVASQEYPSILRLLRHHMLADQGAVRAVNFQPGQCVPDREGIVELRQHPTAGSA